LPKIFEVENQSKRLIKYKITINANIYFTTTLQNTKQYQESSKCSEIQKYNNMDTKK